MSMHAEQSMNMDMIRVMTLAAMAGAAVALLFAPRKGSETREQLRQSFQSAKQASRETVEAGKSKVQDSVDKMKHRTETTLDGAKDVVAEARSQVEDAAAEPKVRNRRTVPPVTPA